MQRENYDDGIASDESRRSFMKKGALASGGVALGLASSGTTVADSTMQQQPNQILVFAYDYNPGIPLQVVSRLQQGTVNSILGRSVGDDERQIVSDPQDYNGYVVLYQPSQDAPGEYTLIFVRDGSLATGQSYNLGADATFFNSEANLLTAGLTSGDGGGGDGG